MNEFSSQIAEAQSNIKKIEGKIDLLIKKKNEVINSTGDEQKEISQEIGNIVTDVEVIQKSMDSLIKKLQNSLLEDKQNKPDDPENRIKENLFGSMIKKYQHTCIRFQDIENELSNINQTKLVRAAEIVLERDLNDQEKREVINDPQMVKQYYEKKLTGAAHIKLQNAVSDIEERYKDIKKLEKSIMQVHSMVIQLSKLVQMQGEMIENISQNIGKAKDYVQKGEVNIKKAKKCMEQSRRTKCCILIIVIVVLLVILIPIIIAAVK